MGGCYKWGKIILLAIILIWSIWTDLLGLPTRWVVIVIAAILLLKTLFHKYPRQERAMPRRARRRR